MASRLHDRFLRFSKDAPLRVAIPSDTGPIHADGVELTSEDLVVALRASALDAIKAVRTLEGVIINQGAPTERTLSKLQVGESIQDADGDFLLRLGAADDETRAALWLLGGMLTTGLGTAPPSTAPARTGVDAIPARGQYTEPARLERLEFMRRESGASLLAIEQTTLVPKRLTSNIENLVSSVEIPVGVAGPLWFHGEHASGVVYCPLATTEGALVASATRGARALTRSGGVTTRVLAQRMLRVPLFVLSNLPGAMLFAQWVRDHVEEIREQATRVSQYASLIDVQPVVLGRGVHVQFLYETGDAAGQNMTTSCTWHACQWLMSQMKYFDDIVFDNFVIDANMSGDKKVNYQSFLRGRGTRVVADAFLDRESIEQVLKVTPEQLAKTNHHFLAGSFGVGMIGYNINVANVIAAVYAATGQDIACVHESSLGQLHVEMVGDGIQASMLLPSLIVGTVGGGTHLARQQDYLSMMGCAGHGKAARLAEIIAGYCLAIDLSTLSAIASGQFAHAHERLGRNRPVQWFVKKDLDAAFFENAMRDLHGEGAPHVHAVHALDDVPMGSSIITELTARKVSKLVGHFPHRLHTAADGGEWLDVMVKVKPLDEEVIIMTNNLASMCGPRLAQAFARFKARTDFVGCDERELAIYQQTDVRFTRHAPTVHGIVHDESREMFVLVLELLRDMELMDTADDVSRWTEEHLEAAVDGLAELHAIWWRREAELSAQPWIGFVQTESSMLEMVELWEALAAHARDEFPEWIGESDLAQWQTTIRSLASWWPEMNEHPKTLIHNDFNPRNVCFRRLDDGLRLCAYDWELATIGLPQHDLAELLAFVLPVHANDDTVTRYVERHRVGLEKNLGTMIDPESWRRGYRLALLDLTINRFGLYLMAHTFRHYGFMRRAVETLRSLCEIEDSRDGGIE